MGSGGIARLDELFTHIPFFAYIYALVIYNNLVTFFFNMRVNSIKVQNFRCFESMTVNFDSRLTVLVGKNGAGKSTVLDAVTIALGALSSELVRKTS